MERTRRNAEGVAALRRLSCLIFPFRGTEDFPFVVCGAVREVMTGFFLPLVNIRLGVKARIK
jgi:hypothetical protein